jgi:Tfp pilus assembly protein FimV
VAAEQQITAVQQEMEVQWQHPQVPPDMLVEMVRPAEPPLQAGAVVEPAAVVPAEMLPEEPPEAALHLAEEQAVLEQAQTIQTAIREIHTVEAEAVPNAMERMSPAAVVQRDLL